MNAVGVIDRVRARWLRFMGREIDLGLQDAQRAADESELAFRKALFESSKGRERFDTRPPAAKSDPPPSLTLEDLREKLEEEDRLMREALDEDPDR